MKCGNCKYWEADEGEVEEYFGTPYKLGWCHRYPPFTKPLTTGKHGYIEVNESDWCGEFREITPETKYPPFNFFKFGVRTQRMLEQLGIKTIEELIACPKHEMFGVRNFGPGSYEQLENKLKTYGIKL